MTCNVDNADKWTWVWRNVLGSQDPVPSNATLDQFHVCERVLFDHDLDIHYLVALAIESPGYGLFALAHAGVLHKLAAVYSLRSLIEVLNINFKDPNAH